MMMKSLVALLALIPALAAADVTTDFTLGPPRTNYIPALTQDGQPTSGIWSVDYIYDCGLNTCYGGPLVSIYIELPNDPVNTGNRLNIGCTGTVTLDTRPAYGAKTQQPPGVLEASESCPFSEPWYSGEWDGTVTYNYVSVKQRHCSSGHPVCVTAFYPVFVGGSGTLTTADPPPPPPPPPPPVVSVIGGGAVSADATTILAVATPGQTVAVLQFDIVNYLAVVTNADGTTPAASLDYVSARPTGDDSDSPWVYSIYGTLFNPDGTAFGSYDCELTVVGFVGVISGGTFTEYLNAP